MDSEVNGSSNGSMRGCVLSGRAPIENTDFCVGSDSLAPRKATDRDVSLKLDTAAREPVIEAKFRVHKSGGGTGGYRAIGKY